MHLVRVLVAVSTLAELVSAGMTKQPRLLLAAPGEKAPVHDGFEAIWSEHAEVSVPTHAAAATVPGPIVLCAVPRVPFGSVAERSPIDYAVPRSAPRRIHDRTPSPSRGPPPGPA